MDNENIKIQIKRKTANDLKSLKKIKRETYDDVISRLLFPILYKTGSKPELNLSD